MAQNDLPATIIESDKGKPMLPPERFQTSTEVRDFASAMIEADNTRSDSRHVVDGLIEGFQPVDPALLASKKMSWYPNANYRGAESYIQGAQTAFYDLVTEADPCIEITLDYGKGQERDDLEDIIAKHWTWLMLNRWRLGLNFHVPMCQREMLVHGVGAHVWPQMNVANWIERTPRTGHLLFPEGSPVNFEDEGEAFMLRDFIPLHALYRFIQNESAATTLGWLPDNVWKTMARVSKNVRSDNHEDYVRQMKQGDQGGSISRQSGVWVNWVFVREIDSSKVSLYAVPETVDAEGYLFKKRNLYETWPMVMFPYDIGNGTIHSIRGLGTRIRDIFQLKNRVTNTMVAQVMTAATILLQQRGAVDRAQMRLQKFGMMTLLPQNVEVAQGLRFPDLSQGPLALDDKLDDTLRKNTQAYASGSPEAKDRETALSYAMRAQDSSQVSKGAHGLYGSHLCNYWEIKLRMVLRAAKMSGDKPYIKMAKEFVDRCKKDDVPDEALDHICEVREVMSTGAGSAAARLQSMMLIKQEVYPETTDDRKVNILRDLAGAAIAGAKVDRYAPSLTDNNNLMDDDDTIIALENGEMSRGGQAVASTQQNHVKHARGHLQGAGGMVEALEQGQMEPMAGLAAIRAYGEHIASHLEKLMDSPMKQADYKALQKELTALGSIEDKLQGQIEAAQDTEEAPPEQELSEKGQLAMLKAQNQEQVRNLKLQGSEERAWRQLQFSERVADVKTAAEIRRKNSSLAMTR